MHSSSEKDDRDLARKTECQYKKKGQDESPPVDGHIAFPNRILQVQLSRHYVKPTDMKYDRSTDPHEHPRDFEHRMVCNRAIDEVKCRAFPITLTGLASKWFTLSIGSILTFVKVRELFLTESTTGIDNTKHSINFLAAIRMEIQVIAKEFIYPEEVSRVVTTAKNPHTHTAPRVNAKPDNPRNNQRDSGFKGHPNPLKQKFKNYALLAAPIMEIYPQISEKNIISRARLLKGRINPKYKKHIFVL
ncbi:hypothetical protein PIB30_002464 [Stylosanthes scabra]|uniref:Uncharacterized protein n=1 Tax=Stylosanthes scabra TaxID=79078 RepID=A0ABU6X2A7_9FABA|nr:hypothetical protein [Stylosanthes scabra]